MAFLPLKPPMDAAVRVTERIPSFSRTLHAMTCITKVSARMFCLSHASMFTSSELSTGAPSLSSPYQVHGSNQGSHRLGSSPALSGFPSKKILVEHVFFLVGQADAPETLPPIRPLIV